MSLVYHQRQRDDLVPWTDRLELAKVVANTDFVPKPMRGNPPAIMAAILYGGEVGLGPMQSLRSVVVIEGVPTLKAETMRGKILSEGHELRLDENTVTRVTLSGRRRDSDVWTSVTWTMDDAKRAGIAGRHNYRAYPRQMLLARATAELARAIFADAIGGLAATEELEGDEGGTAVDAPAPLSPDAPQKKTTRRRRTVSPPETTAAPEPSSAPEAPPVPGDEAPETERRTLDAVPERTPEGADTGEAPRGHAPPADTASPAPSPTPGEAAMEAFIEDASEPTGDDRPITEAMRTALNVHVRKLRDEAQAVTTESLYYAVGTLRRQTPDEVIADVGGVDDDGVLRWRFLRDSLNRGEGRQLREWFEAKEKQLAQQGGPPVPGDE